MLRPNAKFLNVTTSHPSHDARPLADLLAHRRVVVTVGCGGVGKTTVAAAIALAAARRGERVLCLTIDPARRLAGALGLERMTGEAVDVAPERFRAAGLEVAGSLTVMMLDARKTFDDLVARHASSSAAGRRILDNPLYHHLSTHLSGTRDYMAMEKLLQLESDERYDRIILDTPPTSNALDFLEAPERLTGAIDSPATRWFVEAFDGSRRFSLNLLARGASLVFQGLGKLTGGAFLEQLARLILDLNDLFGGFQQRAGAVARAFRSSRFGYVLIASPQAPALREAGYFAERLREQSMSADALVVNRVTPDVAIPEPEESGGSTVIPEALEEPVARAVADERAARRREARQLEERPAALRTLPVLTVDRFAGAVHDLVALAKVGRALDA